MDEAGNGSDGDIDLEEELFGDLDTEESLNEFVEHAYANAYPTRLSSSTSPPAEPKSASPPTKTPTNPSASPTSTASQTRLPPASTATPRAARKTLGLKASASGSLEGRLAAARRHSERRVVSVSKAALSARTHEVNKAVAVRMFEHIVSLQSAKNRETVIGTLLELPARYGTNLWTFVSGDEQANERQRMRMQGTFTGFERLSVEAEVEQRLSGLPLDKLESIMGAFLSKGKDPHFRCQTLDEEFRSALGGTGEESGEDVVVDEALVKGYLNVVLENENVKVVDRTVARFIPHISARKHVACFALQRVGEVVSILLSALLRRDVATKALAPGDIVDYAQRGLRVMLRAVSRTSLVYG